MQTIKMEPEARPMLDLRCDPPLRSLYLGVGGTTGAAVCCAGIASSPAGLFDTGDDDPKDRERSRNKGAVFQPNPGRNKHGVITWRGVTDSSAVSVVTSDQKCRRALAGVDSANGCHWGADSGSRARVSNARLVLRGSADANIAGHGVTLQTTPALTARRPRSALIGSRGLRVSCDA
ncbi:hypothetical protein MRX96_059541 [Rhipicephalus microplus]